MAGPSNTSITPTWFAPQGPREGLGHYVEVIREHLRLIVGCVIVAAAIAGLYAKLAPQTWTAESHLLVTPVNGEANLIGLGLITNSSNPSGDVSTASSLVATSEVANLVAGKIGHTTSQQVLKDISAVPVAQSNIVSITATASSAARAQAIADAFALATVANRTEKLHNQLDRIIPALQAQVQALPTSQQTGQGSLGERLAALEALRAAPDPTISVESLAQRPTAPSWPKTKLSILAGIFVGLIIGVGSAFVLEGVDPRIRREETLRRIFRLPILARIPRERYGSSHQAPLRPDELSPVALESYRMLRVALGLRGASIVDTASDHARSVMITGSTSSEGKSTVALNLAWALASAGHSVILIEADVRRPTLGATLGINASRGIAGVLMREIDLEDALIPVDMDAGDGSIRVLLVEQAGAYLADGLLASGPELLEHATRFAEYVIIDAPPVTEVGDALPLTQYVDDVLLVARLGHTRTDQLVNLGEILARSGVRPSGMVVVGDELSYRGGYYAEPSAKPRGRRRHLPINA